jgi:hypothetical protein
MFRKFLYWLIQPPKPEGKMMPLWTLIGRSQKEPRT